MSTDYQNESESFYSISIRDIAVNQILVYKTLLNRPDSSMLACFLLKNCQFQFAINSQADLPRQAVQAGATIINMLE